MTYEGDFKIVELERRIQKLEDVIYEYVEKPQFKQHCRQLERKREIIRKERL